VAHYFEIVVFLFNAVNYVPLFLCLCICIVMYVLYSVSLCCFVYCLCANVYRKLPPDLNPIAVNKIYQYLNISIKPEVVSQVYIGAGVKFTTHIRLIPSLRKSRVIPLLSPAGLHGMTGTNLTLCHISSKGQD